MLGRSLVIAHPDEANAVFTEALDELDDADPELARLLEAGLIVNALVEPHLEPRVTDRLARIRDRSGPDTVGAKKLLAMVAYHDALAGQPAAVGLARRALAGGTLLQPEHLSTASLPGPDLT